MSPWNIYIRDELTYTKLLLCKMKYAYRLLLVLLLCKNACFR